MYKTIFQILTRFFERFDDFVRALFDPAREQDYPYLNIVWILALYILGVYFWGTLLHWNQMPLGLHDWWHLNAPRFDFVRKALWSGQLPLHMSSKFPLLDVTDRYFAIPDVVSDPQMLLLTFISLTTYFFLDTIFHYTLATIGLLWFRRKFNLSLVAFSFVFFLFNFNGFIESHYAVGHVTWAAYLLLPFFFALVFILLEKRPDWRWVALMSGLFFYMILAGGIHFYIWLLLFLGILALVRRDRFWWIFAALLLSGLLSAVRLLPPVSELSDFSAKPELQYIIGYPSVVEIIIAMVGRFSPYLFNPLHLVGLWREYYWEFDLYVGLAGALFIFYFGLLRWLDTHGKRPAWLEFLAPVAVLTALAIGQNYAIVRAIPFPLFASERIISRMAMIPIVTLLFLATIFYQDWLGKHGSWVRYLSLLFFGLVFNDLWQHTLLWRVNQVVGALGTNRLDLTTNVVANHPDPVYTNLLAIGMAVTLLTAAFLLFMVFRERRLEKRV